MQKKGVLIAIAIVLTIIVTAAATYVFTTSLGSNDNASDFWQQQYSLANSKYTDLLGDYNNLIDSYNDSSDYWYEQYSLTYDEMADLLNDYNDLVVDYNTLIDEYGALYAPSTLIKNGEIFWRINKLDETIVSWTVDVDTYREYVLIAEPDEYETLYNSITDENYLVKDLTQYVQSDFFIDVISDLTEGNNASEFVAEVVNLKNQLITYGSGLGDFYRLSAETLTEGRGMCGDTSILVASLLKAGESIENYGLNVSFWYCDADNMNNPQTVNHVIVGVEYSDGDFDLIETTTDEYYSYDDIVGWQYEV
jgi:hypothetical protein